MLSKMKLLVISLATLLLYLAHASAQSCLPNLNDGGVWESWAAGSREDTLSCPANTVVRLRMVHVNVYYAGSLTIKDSAENILHFASFVDHFTDDDANEVDIVSPDNQLTIQIVAIEATSKSEVTIHYKCELPSGTQVADYYSAGVRLLEVTTSRSIAQEFVARHSSAYLLHLNLGVVDFAGSVRILKGSTIDGGCAILLHEETDIHIESRGEAKQPPFGPNVVDGSPLQNQGISGPEMTLIRLSTAIHLTGNEVYMFEIIPNGSKLMKLQMTEGTGKERHNLLEVASALVVGMEMVTFVPSLRKQEGLTMTMASSSTSVLDTNSMMNQPSVSLWHGTNAIIDIQSTLVIPSRVVVVQHSRGITQASLQQVGDKEWTLTVSGIQAGIDVVEIYDESASLLAMVTVYVTPQITLTASYQYMTEQNWSSPDSFFVGWSHHPTTVIQELEKLVAEVFSPLGIQLTYKVNGLIAIAGLDVNGDDKMTDYDEWTSTPFLDASNSRHFPDDFNDYFVNIYAVRSFAEISATGAVNGGGTSRVMLPGTSLGNGAFVKTWSNRDDVSVASTLLHEIGHCLGLAHNVEWFNYAAMDLGNAAMRQNVMAVGRSDDNRFSPRQWLTVRQVAKLHGTGQILSSIGVGGTATATCATIGPPMPNVCDPSSPVPVSSSQSVPATPTLAPVAVSVPQPTALPTTPPVPQPTPPPTTPPVPQPNPPPITPPVPQPTPPPTTPPVPQPTPLPTIPPVPQPTPLPTIPPVPQPTPLPTTPSFQQPTLLPTTLPVQQPTPPPTEIPDPSSSPSAASKLSTIPSKAPAIAISDVPSLAPLFFFNSNFSHVPSLFPSQMQTTTPSADITPSNLPSQASMKPSSSPVDPASVPAATTPACIDFKLDLSLDMHPQDTTWKVLSNDGEVILLAEGGNYVLPFDTVEYEQCLPPTGCYVFELYDALNDGICSNAEGSVCGSYAVTVNGELLQSGAKFGGRVSTPAFGTCVPQKSPLCGSGQYFYEWDIVFDNYPRDSSWEITSTIGGTTLVASDGSYTTTQPLLSVDGCLPANDCYQLILLDQYGDGICCATGFGSFQFAVDGIRLWTGGEFRSTTTSPTFGECPPA